MSEVDGDSKKKEEKTEKGHKRGHGLKWKKKRREDWRETRSEMRRVLWKRGKASLQENP